MQAKLQHSWLKHPTGEKLPWPIHRFKTHHLGTIILTDGNRSTQSLSHLKLLDGYLERQSDANTCN